MKTQAFRSYFWLFCCLTVAGFALDQASKYGIFAALYNEGQGGEVPLIPGAFEVVAQFTHRTDPGDQFLSPLRIWGGDRIPHVNHGALFGLGSRDGKNQNANLVFAFISLAAAGAISWWATRPATARDGALCLALGLILAGTLGNLYDRVVFYGVRDFLYWYYVIDWPVFNLADCFLVCGAGLLLVQAFFAKAEEGAQEQEAGGQAEPLALATAPSDPGAPVG